MLAARALVAGTTRMAAAAAAASSTAGAGAAAAVAAAAPAAALHVERRLEELGLKMPAPSKPVASYVMATRVGSMLYTAGHLPQPADGPLITGKVGKDLTTEQGADAAKAVALNILATLKGACARAAAGTNVAAGASRRSAVRPARHRRAPRTPHHPQPNSAIWTA